MVQQNLFPQEVSGPSPANTKQPHPQRAAIAAGGAAPAASLPSNRQAPQRIQQVPQHESQDGRAPAARAGRFHSQNGGRIRLSGRIGRYFDVKRTQRGTLLAVFSVATARPYRDESGNWLKKTAWQRVVVWGEAAQAVGQRLRKGAQVHVEGKLKTREWTDYENQLHTTTELVARDVRFVEAAGDVMAA